MQDVQIRVNDLERMMMELIYAQRKAEMRFEEFVGEMKDFKEEMKDFKDEMKDFKDEMKDFKDEMKDFKNDSNIQWGNLANKMGTLIEDIVAPSMSSIAKNYFNCGEIDLFLIRPVKRMPSNRSKIREFDAILVCGDKILLNETKSSPNQESIEKFHQFLLSGEFFDYFPEHLGKQLIPIYASLIIPEHLVSVLTELSIYGSSLKGDQMTIINFNELKGLQK